MNNFPSGVYKSRRTLEGTRQLSREIFHEWVLIGGMVMDNTKKAASNISRVCVNIFNEEYVVRGDENPEYIEMLASYIDRRMRMYQSRNPNLSPVKVAVLVALNLADELNKLQEDYDELVKALEEKKNRMG